MMLAVRQSAILIWALLLAACTVQLVPGYDQSLVDGLDEANTTALTLFAAVESGSPQAEFGDYEERYAELIGKFDALRQRASARQIPPLAGRISRMRMVADFCNAQDNPTSCLNVSPSSLEQVLLLLRRMRDSHRNSGLAADTVNNFRDGYNVAIGQALTIENALKR